jgi:HK97 family phage prohead protease
MGVKSNNIEKRSYFFDIQTRDDENEGIVILSGRPIVYNSRTNLGLFDEIIEQGALDGADLTDVRFLVNHDTSKIPLARSRRNNGNSTMQFSVDQEGMAIDWVKLDVKNNDQSRALASAVKRGDVTGMSFMFILDEDGYEWQNLETDHPTRVIKRITSVIEVSAVTFPAYEATSIEVNQRNQQALESARAALESARKREDKPLDSELELLKAKTMILCNM